MIVVQPFPAPPLNLLSKLRKGGGNAFIVDGSKVASFDQSRANNRVSIADVSDKMRIDNFRQCAGKTPSYQWHACPFWVRSFGYEQNPIWVARLRM